MRKKIEKIEQMLERLKPDASWEMIEHTVYLAYFEGRGDGIDVLIKNLILEVKK